MLLNLRTNEVQIKRTNVAQVKRLIWKSDLVPSETLIGRFFIPLVLRTRDRGLVSPLSSCFL